MDEIQALRQEVAELTGQVGKLRQQIAEQKFDQDWTTDWITGLHITLGQLTIPLLMKHPHVKVVRNAMADLHRRYEQYRHNPDPDEEQAKDRQCLSGSLFFRAFANAGVWPDVDAQQFQDDLSTPENTEPKAV